jgi:hypothetical protein
VLGSWTVAIVETILRYRGSVTPRWRILAFGSAAALVIAGVLCAVLVAGVTGELLTIVLISLGLGGALLLVFLEIGLGEEQERAHEAELRRRTRQRRKLELRQRPRLRNWPRRPR